MQAEPQKQHQWLQQLVGEWTYESDCAMGPDQPNAKFRGSETVRSLGGLWVLGEGQGEMPGGGTGRMLITIGYDPQKGRFVGTWIGSMMTNLWVYDGFLDDAGSVLTLEAKGPSFADPAKIETYRDIIEIKSENQRVLTSNMRGEDGVWRPFMTATYTRTR